MLELVIMNVGIFSIRSELYSTKRLIEEFKNLNCQVEVINYLREYFILDQRPSNKNFQIIVPRFWHKIIQELVTAIDLYKKDNSYILNSVNATLLTKNKVDTLSLIARNCIPIPKTIFGGILFSYSFEEVQTLLGNNKILIKPIYGSQGKNIHLISTVDEWEEIKAKSSFENYFQEYLEECRGEDIRCLVLGNKIIGSMKRKNSFSFLSNIHQGGQGESVQISPEEANLVLEVAKITNLDFVGIDILRSKKGPLVIDVNSTPGFEGMEKALNLNIASMVAKFSLSMFNKK